MFDFFGTLQATEINQSNQWHWVPHTIMGVQVLVGVLDVGGLTGVTKDFNEPNNNRIKQGKNKTCHVFTLNKQLSVQAPSILAQPSRRPLDHCHLCMMRWVLGKRSWKTDPHITKPVNKMIPSGEQVHIPANGKFGWLVGDLYVRSRDPRNLQLWSLFSLSTLGS